MKRLQAPNARDGLEPCRRRWAAPARGRGRDAGNVEALHAMIPGSTLRVIPEAGHLVIEERPDALVREILAFLRTRSPG